MTIVLRSPYIAGRVEQGESKAGEKSSRAIMILYGPMAGKLVLYSPETQAGGHARLYGALLPTENASVAERE